MGFVEYTQRRRKEKSHREKRCIQDVCFIEKRRNDMYIGGTCTLLLSTFVRKPSDVPKTARHNSIAEPSSLTYSPYSDCLTLV